MKVDSGCALGNNKRRAISEPARTRSLPPEEPPDMENIEAAAQEYKVEILGPPPGAQT
jgi:hypothetical protein